MANGTLTQYARFFQAQTDILNDSISAAAVINAQLLQELIAFDQPGSVTRAMALVMRMTALHAQVTFSLHQIIDTASAEEEVITLRR
jgi:hypothetical protein